MHLFASACSGCPFVSGVLWSLFLLFGFCCGVAGFWWPFVFAVVFPWLPCFALLLVCGVASAWLALYLLCFPCSARPSVSPLVPSAPVSVLLVPPSGIWFWLYLGRPVVMPMAWCVVTAWHLSSLLFMATKASALCEALPSTPCCECCFGALLSALRFSSLGDLDLSQDAARAACALLLGLCCFLPPVLAAFLGALLSCCCWPPPAVFSLVFRSLAFSARFAAFVCFGVWFVALSWPLVVFVGLFLSGVFGLFLPFLFRWTKDC